MIYYSIYIYLRIYIYIHVYLHTCMTRYAIKKIYEFTQNSEKQYHLPNWPMFFCKSHACFSSLSPVSAPSFDESSGGKVPHPNNPPWIPKIAERNWWIQQCWIVFMKICLPINRITVCICFSSIKICLQIKRVIFFCRNTFSSYDFSANCFEIHIQSHTLIEWSKDQGISGHISIFGALLWHTFS